MTDRLSPWIVLCSGSPGRDGWIEGNGPQPGIIWAASRRDAIAIARKRHWPQSVRVDHLLALCQFHCELQDVLDEEPEPW